MADIWLAGGQSPNGYVKIDLYLSYSTSTNYSGNYSTITCGMYVNVSGNGSVGPWNTGGGSTLAGSTFNGQIPSLVAPATHWLVSGVTKTVYHNLDGTGSAGIDWKWTANSSWAGIYTPSGTAWIGLPTIPRGASISSAPNFNDEENPTIKYSNPAGNNATKLEACISLTSSQDDIKYRSIPKTGSSYTFELTDAEREVLRNATTTANSRSVYFYVRSTVNGTQYHSNIKKTLTIVNANPTLSPTVLDVDSAAKAITGDNTKLIKYFSDALCQANPIVKKGATISTISIKHGGITRNSNSTTFTDVENGKFEFSITDSRGNTASQTINATMFDYVKLTANIAAKVRVDGTASINLTGNYYSTFGGKANVIKLEYRWKEQDGTYSNWIEATSASRAANTYNTTITLSGLDYRKAYVFQSRATDLAMTATSAETIGRALPVFDWGENDFNFNVPVRFSAGILPTEQFTMPTYSDWVVEQGTQLVDGVNWTYRLWNSGIGECWGKKVVNTACSTAWGNLFVSGALDASAVDFPFNFTEIPTVNASLVRGNAGAFLIASGSGGTAPSIYNTGGFEIARGITQSTANDYTINYQVMGRWK